MKNLLFVIVVYISLLGATIPEAEVKGKSLNKYEYMEVQPRKKMNNYIEAKYEEVIALLKKQEGFRSTPYDDAGYPCIGYGQRLAFFPDTIKWPITEEQGDSILKVSFQNHIRAVDYYYPGLNKVQRYAVAHMSYTMGIGNLIEYKYLYRSNGSWVLNNYQLFNRRKVDREHEAYKASRQFEYELFNS